MERFFQVLMVVDFYGMAPMYRWRWAGRPGDLTTGGGACGTASKSSVET